jgi:hypothetical protein
MGAIETIRVVDGDGFITINAADFDPAVHVRWGDPGTSVDSAAPSVGEVVESPDAPLDVPEEHSKKSRGRK